MDYIHDYCSTALKFVRLRDNRVIGFEGLSRFDTDPIQPPNLWFDSAKHVHLQPLLETTAIRKLLTNLDRLPDDTYLALNVSPETIAETSLLQDVFGGINMERIVLEITEHAVVENYGALLAALTPYRKRGMRLAIDDVGAGFSSLKHILDEMLHKTVEM